MIHTPHSYRMRIPKPVVRLMYLLTRPVHNGNQLVEYISQVAEFENIVGLSELFEQFANCRMEMVEPESIEFYLHYYELSAKLVKLLKPITRILGVNFAWLIGNREVLFDSIDTEPVIALYNCAVAVSLQSDMPDIKRVEAVEYYISAAQGLLEEFEVDDLNVLSMTLSAATQELRFMVGLVGGGQVRFGDYENSISTKESAALHTTDECNKEHAGAANLTQTTPALPELPDMPALPNLDDIFVNITSAPNKDVHASTKPIEQEQGLETNDESDNMKEPLHDNEPETSPSVTDESSRGGGIGIPSLPIVSELEGSNALATEPEKPSLPTDNLMLCSDRVPTLPAGEGLAVCSEIEGPEDITVPDEVIFDPATLGQSGIQELTKAVEVVAEMYKYVYKTVLRVKSTSSEYEFLKYKYEYYKTLSKYVFCVLLKGINMQYCKLVAEETIKEADHKYVDSEIIEQLAEMEKYDNSDELEKILATRTDLKTVEPYDDIQVPEGFGVYPKNYNRILELTYAKAKKLFESRNEQLEQQRDGFIEKIREIREYVAESGEFIMLSDRTKEFRILCAKLTAVPIDAADQTGADELEQLMDLNAQSKQIYDYLAALVQTDNNNKKTYGSGRWNSGAFVAAVYNLMEEVVSEAERVEREIVVIKNRQNDAALRDKLANCAELDGIRQVLAKESSYRAEKLAHAEEEIAKLDKLEEQLQRCFSGIDAGSTIVETFDQFKEYITRYEIALRFDERVTDKLIDGNKEVVKEHLEGCVPNDTLTELDQEMTTIYQEMQRYNDSFVEQRFSMTLPQLEKLAVKYCGGEGASPASLGQTDVVELIISTREKLVKIHGEAEKAGQAYTQQVEQEWPLFAANAASAMIINQWLSDCK